MSTLLTCSRCGAPVDRESRFCRSCGNQVSAERGPLPTGPAPTTPIESGLLPRLRSVTLGEYEIYGELGRGGMATVFLAHDIGLDRKVAIKVVAPSVLEAGSGMGERFKREARTAGALSHPHIIPIHAVREVGQIVYLVMKYVDGPTLDAIIRQHGPLPIAMVQTILVQVASALGYAHKRGIVHRDIKPANIMVDEEGSAVVTDFGIAKVANARSLTMTGATIGTPAYMSPEQCAATEVTGASDQYSLGIVAYEMLTGRTPFQSDSVGDLMMQHFNDAPRAIGEMRPDCPSGLAGPILRMLAKEPTGRWPTMEAAVAAIGARVPEAHDPVRTELMTLARTATIRITRAPTPGSPVPPVRPAIPPRPKTPFGKGALWGGAAVGVVLTLAVGAYFARRTRPPEPPPAELPAQSAAHVIAALEIADAPGALNPGDHAQLTASARNASGARVGSATVIWSSSDRSVAVVSDDGTLTALAPGSTTLTATSGGASANVDIIVREPAVAILEVKPRTANLALHRTVQLVAVAKDARGSPLAGQRLEWSSSNPAAVTVSRTGLATAIAAGTATVTAAHDDVRSAPVTVTVPPRAPSRPGILQMLIVPAWAYVFIDGVARGQRTRGLDTLAARVTHRLRFERDGFETIDTTVTLRPGEQRLITIQIKRRSP